MAIGISNAAAINILKLVFQSTSWSGYATNDATQTNIGISLHLTPGPTDAGDATSNEVVAATNYAGYLRVNVARSTPGGWTAVTTGPPASTSPTANIDFPLCTANSCSVTQFATSASNASPNPSGAQAILWSGDVSPPISVSTGVTPRLTTATTITLT